jgi:hypothetical protein
MIKKLLAFLAIVIGKPVVLVFLLLLKTGGIPVPTEPDWLYDHFQTGTGDLLKAAALLANASQRFRYHYRASSK